MTSQEPLRRGTTIRHNGEPLTVVRVVGGTVVARDSHGHTRHLWKAQVLEAMQAAAHSGIPAAPSPEEITIRACESLGVAATAVAADLDDAGEFLRTADEYRREVLGGRASRRPVPDSPRPVVHLFTVSEPTPPHAA